MKLQAPQVVAVPSSHGEQPVFAKLYLPKDYQQGQKRRAVIFNHGAGYLQNSDLGWSNYFREFFFHNILIEQGYVVLDMITGHQKVMAVTGAPPFTVKWAPRKRRT
jgi:dipeptidyl aminopeptidase/acylaminoacyl peptidase